MNCPRRDPILAISKCAGGVPWSGSGSDSAPPCAGSTDVDVDDESSVRLDASVFNGPRSEMTRTCSSKS